MPRFRLLAALAVLLPVVASAQERVAVLVGVNHYDNRRLDNLKYAEKDVADLEPVLKAAGFKVRTLLGGKAKRADVEAALAEALTGRTKKDLVLLAFAGHGVQLTVKDGPAEKEMPFFCPVDAVPSEPRTLVSFNVILKALDDKGGGQNLLLVDACRNVFDENRGSRGGVNGSRIDGLAEGTAVFFSCSGRQKAYETDKAGGGHGVFFHFVLEGLRGQAADAKGRVTWDRLVPYVKEQVTESFPLWFADVTADHRQRPHAIGSLTDDPVLVPTINKELPGEAAYQRGRKLEEGLGTAIDNPAALRAYREAAEVGHPLGLATLASFYLTGNVVAKDEAEAQGLARRSFAGVRAAAERGRADAQCLIGYMYDAGLGVSKDSAEAVRWTRKAADQNHAFAQNNLGTMYEMGLGVTKDEAEAVRLYRLAADQNLSFSQFRLAYMYDNGLGVQKDSVQAARLVRLAADRNFAEAQTYMGILYESGRGVSKDVAEAVRWYRKAAAQGDANARSALQRLTKKP